MSDGKADGRGLMLPYAQYYATIKVGWDDKFMDRNRARARYNRVFFPESVKSRRRRVSGDWLHDVIRARFTESARELTKMLSMDLYGRKGKKCLKS